MINKIALISLLVVSTLCVSSPSYAKDDYNRWIGPHINLHFGDHEVEVSLGLEASVWTITEDDLGNQDGPPFLGLDVGIEYNFSREIWVRYAEFQVGALLAGASVGVVSDDDYGAGLQTSLWGNLVVGGMFRCRQFWDTEYYREGSIGAYVKAPYMEPFSSGLFWDTPFYTGDR